MIKRIVVLITVFISFSACAEMSKVDYLKSLSPSAYEAAVFTSKHLNIDITDSTIDSILGNEIFQNELGRLNKKILLKKFCVFNQCDL